MPCEQQNGLRVNCLELSAACPFDQTNPEDCPLFPLRKREPTKRLQRFNALTEIDLVYLAAYHSVYLTIQPSTALPLSSRSAVARFRHPSFCHIPSEWAAHQRRPFLQCREHNRLWASTGWQIEVVPVAWPKPGLLSGNVHRQTTPQTG